MSPTIDDVTKDLRRDLKPRDVLIYDGGVLYEITEVGEQPHGIRKRTSRYVDVRELTSSGPSSNLIRFWTKGELVWKEYWRGVIRGEDRTDKPSLRER